MAKLSYTLKGDIPLCLNAMNSSDEDLDMHSSIWITLIVEAVLKHYFGIISSNRHIISKALDAPVPENFKYLARPAIEHHEDVFFFGA